MIINLFFVALLWGLIGALPGFYIFYVRQYDTRLGAAIGALLGITVGMGGTRTGLVASPLSAVVIIFGLLGAALLLMPQSQYIKPLGLVQRGIIAAGGLALILFVMLGIAQIFPQAPFNPAVLTIIVLVAYIFVIPRGCFAKQQTTQQRITNLAYALLFPTLLIVLGIVVFPLLWNVVFSVREIRVEDLQNVELFDLSAVTLDNYISQAGIRFDTVPCELADDGSACAVNEEGKIAYVNPRRYYDDYRGYRELAGINRGDERLAIGVRDPEFYPMIIRTIFYTFASTLAAIIFGLVAALIVRENFPGRTIFRGFILFPYIAPVISVAFVWQALLQQRGFFNALLGTNLDYLGTRETFLGLSIPLLMVILFQTWRYFPFAFLFLLARIQAIPNDIYEAAKVDGASPSQRMRHITLPQLRAVFGTLFLLRFIWTFNKFDDIFLLTGPISQTKVIPIQIFEALFTENNVGEASAVAVIMAAMLAIILVIYFKFFLIEEG